MDLILEFETGHPTRLQRHPRLAGMIADLGEPTRIEGQRLFWENKIGAWVPQVKVIAEYWMRFRWRGDTKFRWQGDTKFRWQGDTRRLVRVRLAPN